MNRLLRAIYDDLGRPPRPAAADALVAALVLFVLLFAMALDYPV